METIVKLTSKAGTTFVGIRGYVSSKGEKSNQTIVAGYSYENAKAHDLAILEKANHAELAEKSGYPVELVNTVIAELIKSCTNPEKARSEGQTNAYVHLSNGVKQHVETGGLYVHGLVVSKTVLEKGEYKAVKSSDKTLCKNKVKKLLELRTDKIRQFCFEKGEYRARGQLVKAL